VRDAEDSPGLLAGEEDLAEGISDRQLLIVDAPVLHRETMTASSHSGKRIRKARRPGSKERRPLASPASPLRSGGRATVYRNVICPGAQGRR